MSGGGKLAYVETRVESAFNDGAPSFDDVRLVAFRNVNAQVLIMPNTRDSEVFRALQRQGLA